MKVYILIKYDDDDYPWIIGVFATEAAAKSAIRLATQAGKGSVHDYTIEAQEVQS